jgi:Ca-activated chloride channel family protein
MRALTLLILIAVSLPALAQEGSVERPSDSIQVEVNVVNIPVTVTDDDGRFIVDLKRDDFEVYEDGVRVQLRYFTDSQDNEAKQPLITGFLLDLSNTARLYYKTYKDSIGDLAYLLVPEGGRNKGFLFGFHTEVDQLVDTTNDPYPIASKMETLKHGGGSSMIDAIYRACNEKFASKPSLGSAEPRKVIVTVGDGHDNASKHSLE